MIRHLQLAATAEQFLSKMGRMYMGATPLSNDCRSTVVRFLQAHFAKFKNDFRGQLYVYGFKGSLDVVHVLLVDNHSRVVVDAWRGEIKGSKYVVDTPGGGLQELDLVKYVDTQTFFRNYT